MIIFQWFISYLFLLQRGLYLSWVRGYIWMSMVSHIHIVYIYHLYLFLNQTGHFKRFLFLTYSLLSLPYIARFISWRRLHKVVNCTYITLNLRYLSKGVNFMRWTVNISARVSSLTTPFLLYIYSFCCVSFLSPVNHRLILNFQNFLFCVSVSSGPELHILIFIICT